LPDLLDEHHRLDRPDDPQWVPAAPPGGWPAWFDPSSDLMLTPRRLRGLAHPIRVRLLYLLETDGPATATQLGRRIGQSSGVTSYHLRMLAATPAASSLTGTRTQPATSPLSQRPLVPQWPETRTRKRRNPVEPTRRPAPPAPAERPGRGGQVAQTCRASGSRKRETVIRSPKPSGSGDTGTDLSSRMTGTAENG
jgi:Helix-turn-helix domain